MNRVIAVDDVAALEADHAPLMEEFVAVGPRWAVPVIVATLREQRTRIVANWALRVATLPTFRAMPGLGLDEVQRHIPQILEGALAAIATSDPTMDPGPIERAAELAAAHGRTRFRDDFAIGDVLAEFHALRHEVWSALWRVVELDAESLAHVRALDARLNETFDALVTAASEAWVEAKCAGAVR